MKKINITPKAKKVIMFTTMAVVCIGIITLVFSVTAKSALESTSASSTGLVSDTGISSEATISILPIEDSSSTASETPTFVPSSGASQSAQLTKIEKPTSAPPKPVVQGDASTASNGTKTQPTNSALTNKNNKPSYTSKPTVPATSQPTKNPSKPSGNTPTAGDTNDGKTYIPGFGWVEGTGKGGGVGTTVNGDWGGGSQVGIMN